jgi:NADPH:quinone reductase-like Zn-dependent oxidoreductase
VGLRAIVFTRYGGPEVLELREVPTPTPGDGEVLVQVHAACVNDWDLGNLRGVPFVNRLSLGLRRPKKQILGSDIAGRVEAVGKNAARFRPGDEVFGDLSGRWGGFAEYVCAPENALAPKPPSLTFAEAAAIPQVGMLAVQGLIDMGRLRAGQTLLVNGAGGGVGTLAIQIAKLHGVEATGVDSAGKLGLLRSLGYDHVLDYTREDFTAGGRRYDLILDLKTNRSPVTYLRALSPRGVYVTVGGSTGRLVQAVLLGLVLPLASRKRLRLVALKPNKDLGYMTGLVEAGSVKPVIDSCYPLSDTAAAMRRFSEGGYKGKIVITME